jgi:AAA+ ATPase superfamily predicted ATPase
MEKKLRELNRNGVKPIIILDEFQYLKNIYMDDAKEILLINELFKFFI